MFYDFPALLDSRGNALHLSDEAKLNLYETIGYLVGMPAVPVPTQVRHLDGVLGPRMKRISDILQAAAAAAVAADGGAGAVGGKDNDSVATELAISVGAMANVSKGFKPVVASEVEAMFIQVCVFRGRAAFFFFLPLGAFFFAREYVRSLAVWAWGGGRERDATDAQTNTWLTKGFCVSFAIYGDCFR